MENRSSGGHHLAGLMQQVAQYEEDVNLQRSDLAHHLSRVEEFFLGDLQGSGTVGGVKVDLGKEVNFLWVSG